MSKPLTEEQKQVISWGRWDPEDRITGPAAIDAALDRLDFLESKVETLLTALEVIEPMLPHGAINSDPQWAAAINAVRAAIKKARGIE